MKEVWKKLDFNSYHEYRISNYGTIQYFDKSKNAWVNKSSKINRDGYVYIKDSARRSYSVHHLVWSAFGGKQIDSCNLQLDHINEDKLDNRINNLQLLTNRQNSVKNAKHLKSSRKCEYVGVSKARNKYRATIQTFGKQIHLGVFNSEYVAHLAYEMAHRTMLDYDSGKITLSKLPEWLKVGVPKYKTMKNVMSYTNSR